MAGARQKPAELLVNKRGGRGRGLTLVVPEHRKVPRLPAPPAGIEWGKLTRSFWRSFWRSPVSAAVDIHADAERLYRWIEAIEERDNLLEQIRHDGYAPARKVLVEHMDKDTGVTTIVLLAGAHPSLAYVKHLDREIARLSEHFGMTPLSRFRLQLTFTEAGQSAIRLDRARDGASPSGLSQNVVDLDALG